MNNLIESMDAGKRGDRDDTHFGDHRKPHDGDNHRSLGAIRLVESENKDQAVKLVVLVVWHGKTLTPLGLHPSRGVFHFHR